MSNRYSLIAGNRYEDEQQCLELRPAWRSYWKWYIAIIIALLFLVGSGQVAGGLMIALVLSTIVILLRYRYLFIVTSRRVITRVGLIARNTAEIEIQHTREYKVKQGIVERILNYGDIEISSAAGPGTEVIFRRIIAPQDLKEAIRTVRNGW